MLMVVGVVPMYYHEVLLPDGEKFMSPSPIPNLLLKRPIRPVSSSSSSLLSWPGLHSGLLFTSRVSRMTLRGDVDHLVYVEPSVRMTS